MVQAVAHQERRRGPKADEPKLSRRLGRQLLVQERTDREAARLPLTQQGRKALKGLPAINNILDEQDVFTGHVGFRVVKEPDHPAGNLLGAVGARYQEIHLERTLDLPDQVAQKDEAPLEEAEHEELTLGISRADLPPQLRHLAGDGGLVVHDGPDPLAAGPAEHVRRAQRRHESPPRPQRAPAGPTGTLRGATPPIPRAPAPASSGGGSGAP